MGEGERGVDTRPGDGNPRRRGDWNNGFAMVSVSRVDGGSIDRDDAGEKVEK